MLVFKLYQQYEYDMNKKLKFLKTYVSYILEPLKVYDYLYKNELDNIEDLTRCEISLKIWGALAIASFIVNVGLLALIFIK